MRAMMASSPHVTPAEANHSIGRQPGLEATLSEPLSGALPERPATSFESSVRSGGTGAAMPELGPAAYWAAEQRARRLGAFQVSSSFKFSFGDGHLETKLLLFCRQACEHRREGK
jgi:hypothetical protein